MAADTPAAQPVLPILHLLNEGYVPGELRDSADEAVIRWQSPVFANPFEFSLANVNAVHFPPPAKASRPVADYCFELKRGDVLFGSLVGQNEREMELDVAKIGRVHVKRSSVHRFFRWRESADVIYLGPQGLAGWVASPAGAWRDDLGHLATSQEASLRGDFGLPDRAVVEVEISWKKKPDFVLSLGTGNEDKSNGQAACRFEVWGNEIVVLRELEGIADMAPVLTGLPAQTAQATASSGSAHFQVFLDQKRGRCLVFSASGSRLADLNVVSDKPQVLGGIRLENKHGDVKLERLRISSWTGDLPREVEADQPRIHLTDGSIQYGQVIEYDAAKRQFVVRGKAGDSTVSTDTLDSAFLSFPAETELAAARALFHDGTQVSGDIVKVADGDLWIKSAAIREPLRLPVAGLRSVVSLRHDSASSDKDADAGSGNRAAAGTEGRLGTLELEGVRLRGRLVDGREEPGASCLVWQPVGSQLASALRPGISGRIVYREPPPKRNAAPQAAAPGMPGAVRVARAGVVARAQGGASVTTTVRAGQKGTGQPSMYLLTGDTIPCEVTTIDENGVSFKTSLSDSKFVAHDKIKAVELVRGTSNAPGLTKAKQSRLLTLPRMQKESPPTHLIRSLDGDYLRCRLVGMDDKRLQVEVRLEMKEIPRERVARIIWLHAEDLDKAIAGDEAERTPDGKTARTETITDEVKIRRLLAKPARVEFLDLHLEDCVNYLGENHQTTIAVTMKENGAGVSLKKPITLKMDNSTLGDVLKRMFEPLHLTYTIENEELHLTTSAKAEEKTLKEKIGMVAAEDKIKRSLDMPTQLEFNDLALEDCINYLQKFHEITISVDKQELQDEGVALDQPITLKLAEVSFRSVLRLLLEPVQLSYVIENGEMRIVTTVDATGRRIRPAVDRNPAYATRTGDKPRTRVQVLRNDETRLTFFPDKFAEADLWGASDVLGACRVSLAQIDMLLIGTAIEHAAAQLDYQKWKLQNAVEPKFVNAGDGGDGGDAGTESQLVGKPAPPFELDLLAGGKFKLADQKGHVVVLDFWATWCGPCLAAMPQVDRAVREFENQGVQLVAVNLEEGPKPIKSMLERHKLDLTVALDRDGAVAGKYQASAIPQTVIIDSEGKVVRVFIGGGTHFEEQLRAALNTLFPDAPAQKSAP
jgi:thiol-disulfide isomerase/thioredoxin